MMAARDQTREAQPYGDGHERYEHLIGPKLRTRTRVGQNGEVALAVQVLNRMIRTTEPASVRR
jgi:hypothetical protein